jgi:hypothetical protein
MQRRSNFARPGLATTPRQTSHINIESILKFDTNRGRNIISNQACNMVDQRRSCATMGSELANWYFSQSVSREREKETSSGTREPHIPIDTVSHRPERACR